EFDFYWSGLAAFDIEITFRDFETVAFDRYFVAAGRQFIEFELSLIVSDGVARCARRFTANGDLRAGDHRAVRILDRSGDHAGLAGLRRNGVQGDEAECKEQRDCDEPLAAHI